MLLSGLLDACATWLGAVADVVAGRVALRKNGMSSQPLLKMLRRDDDADASIAGLVAAVMTTTRGARARPAGPELAAAVSTIFWNVLGPVARMDDQEAPAHANFFDLGGDSVLAVALVAELERVTGQALSVTAAYEAPTVAGLVQLLTQPMSVLAPAIVKLREGDATPALFLVHGVGGSCIEQKGLARAMQTASAVYGCQAHGLDGTEMPPDRVEEMASRYLDDVRRIQPHGPYAFAGYSFGGLVAVEMARKAREAGDDVALVALLDTYPSMRIWPWAWKIEVWGRRLTHHLAHVRAMPVSAIPTYVSARLRTLRRQLLGPAPAERVFRIDPATTLTATELVRKANVFAQTWYVPRAYDGEIVFIQSRRTLTLPRRPARFWSGVAASLRIHIVPGDKPGMVREHADVVADILSAFLAQARERWIARPSTPSDLLREEAHG